MPLRPRVAHSLRTLVDDHPKVKRLASHLDDAWSRLVHSAAERLPSLIRPQPRQITIAVTAACNFRCRGCRYGRDFMVGQRLALDVVRHALDDAAAAGIGRARFYGGEPLLHPDLARMIAHGTALGLDCYVTTNGVLLGRRIDELYEAGMRWFTMGYYGLGAEFAEYTERADQLDQLVESLVTVRERYGDRVRGQLNYVLLKPTCNLESFERGWAFAQRFGMVLHLDLLAFNLPFFNHDPALGLKFQEQDRPQIEEIVERVLAIKAADDSLVPHSREFLHSVPDWLILGADMKVPCDAYELIWLGADGSVQLCDGAFPLGNVNEKRLRDILFTPEHVAAARAGFRLECGNCNCKLDSRIRKHPHSFRKYGA